jgi:small subunit ribosomal protein S13
MVRIGNKEIPDNKNLSVALTYIYGIGRTQAQRIINETNLESQKKVGKLKTEEIKLINEKVKQFPTEGELKEKIQKIISEQIRLGTYRGLRRSRKPNPLPIHGQRTRHNARTAKGHKRITVANKKKAPAAK